MNLLPKLIRRRRATSLPSPPVGCPPFDDPWWHKDDLAFGASPPAQCPAYGGPCRYGCRHEHPCGNMPAAMIVHCSNREHEREDDAVLDRLLDLDEAVRDLLRRLEESPGLYNAPVGPVTRMRALVRGSAPVPVPCEFCGRAEV